MVVRYGTSSWSEKSWVGSFYPAGTKPGEFITHYARTFTAVECDATYYAVPTRRLVQGWNEKTPDGFTLAAKFPRSVVHAGQGEKPDASKLLISTDAQRDATAFLEVMRELGPKAGPMVLQFPYFNQAAFRSVREFLDRLEPFLERLPSTFRFGVEVRNKHWLAEELTAALRRHRAALVLVDHPYMPHPADVQLDLVTTDFAYVRLIGDRKATEAACGNRFDRAVLDTSELLRRWAEVFDMLDRRPLDAVYTFANNHFQGNGPATVRELERLVRELGSAEPGPA
jgi:uncharacterized protein YecE (DUF72 family)